MEEHEMKFNRFTALALTAIMSASAAVSCGEKKIISDSSSITPDSSQIIMDDEEHLGENKIKADLLETVSANDTVFTLNSVISPENVEDEGCRYVYFDVNIKNNSDSAYTLSTLNNFYIITEDGTEIFSDIRTQLYAVSNFKENSFFSDPFEIPANGEFKGIIGGFLLNKNVKKFTVGFYPTKDSPRDKDDVMVIDLTSDNIKAPDASVMK